MEKIVEIIEFIQYIAIVFAVLTILPSIMCLMEKDFFPIRPKHVVYACISIVVLQIIKMIMQ